MNVGKYVGRTGFPGSSLNPTFALNPFPNSQQNYKLLWLIVWLYWQYYNDNEISKGYLYYTVPSKMKGKWKVFRDEADLQPAKYSHPKFLKWLSYHTSQWPVQTFSDTGGISEYSELIEFCQVVDISMVNI